MWVIGVLMLLCHILIGLSVVALIGFQIFYEVVHSKSRLYKESEKYRYDHSKRKRYF
jgi:hypothetical protein